MAHIEDVLVRPLLTEKSTKEGEKFNKYLFEVGLKSNKHQIKAAIEKLYDVKVLKVNTSITPGKLKKYGKAVKKTSKYKKAAVLVEQGQKIEFFRDI
ncbi:MAG: 50S ribosomal protein L23 [Bacteriovoracaceae bacterium]|jgi:large subunit ribosomal protein L23|nr:50S ribosomal protein L23 [Bacteriovoracaceae bacterium]